MIRGLYTAASGLMAGLKQQEVMADNLANIETAGFKANTTALHDFRRHLIREVGGGDFAAGPFGSRSVGLVGSGTFLNAQPIDLSQGSVVDTDGPLDLALQGNGYFVLKTPDGNRYTRDGRFRLDAESRLVTGDGMFVLAENGDGPIVVPAGRIAIDESGAITVDGKPVANIRLRDFAPDALERDGNTRFTANGEGEAARLVVHQGVIERSNVDPVRVLTASMGVLQAYTSTQRVFQVQAESLQRAVNEIGRLG